jgi:hypothetical protein
MIHAIPIVIQEAGSPMVGLPVWIALFVVVCVPLLIVFFRVEIEDQVNTWSSNISYLHYSSPNPHRSEITSSVQCFLCVPLPIRGGCRLQTLQYPLSDVSRVEMQPNTEYGQTLKGSACPRLRARFIHLKDHSKQANELLHTASF